MEWLQRRVAASPLARRWIFKKRSLFGKVANDINVTLLNFESLASSWRPRTVQKSSPTDGFIKIVHQRFGCAIAYKYTKGLCVTARLLREACVSEAFKRSLGTEKSPIGRQNSTLTH